MQIKEKGRVYNKNNEGLIKSAYRALRKALRALDIADDDLNKDDEETDDKETKTKEAKGFAINDLVMTLQRELSEEMGMDYRIVDVFPDDTSIVCAKGWMGNQYFQCSYEVDDTGVASFGEMQEVTRKVSYVPTSDNEPPMTMPDMGESQIDFTTDAIKLVEKAVDSNGIVPIKIIQPGQGSSGYYPKEVLERDGPKVFKAGTKMFWDHQTEREEAERPEGSLHNLAAVLVEDAKWRNDGLYAKAKVYENFRGLIDSIGSDLGVSIRASGKAKDSVVDGRRTPVVEAITSAKSIDFVTAAGAGGKVLELFESAKLQTRETKTMTVDPMVKELQLKTARLQESLDAANAERLIESGLAKYDMLPRKTIDRLRSSLIRSYPLDESGVLDRVKFVADIDETVKAEIAYLQEMGAFGQIRGLGDSLQPQVDDKDFEEAMTSLFSDSDLSEAGIKAAIKGRE